MKIAALFAFAASLALILTVPAQSGAANDRTWFVSYTTISGNTATAIDHANDSGKLGRGTTVRTSSTNFTYTGYPTASGGKAAFKATCQKS